MGSLVFLRTLAAGAYETPIAVLRDFASSAQVSDLTSVSEGEHVLVLATDGSLALVAKLDGVSIASQGPSSAHGPTRLLLLKALRYLDEQQSKASNAVSGPARGLDAVSGVDRVAKKWRGDLRRSLREGDRATHHKVRDQLSTLAEWARQKETADAASATGAPSSRISSLVGDSIARLIEASSQQRAGIVRARTAQDETADENNTGVMQLLQLHMDTEARLAAGIRVPASASESLSNEVSKGTHGGPSVANDRATDVSGLWASTGGKAATGGEEEEEEAEITGKAPLGPLAAVAEEISNGYFGGRVPAGPRCLCPVQDHSMAFEPVPGPGHKHGLVQILVEVDVWKAMAASVWPVAGASASSPGGGPGSDSPQASLSQACELYLSLWDATTSTWIGEDVVVHIDAQGQPVVVTRKNSLSPQAVALALAGDSSSTQRPGTVWSQAVFSNVPRQCANSGRLYLVLKLVRKGQLKEAAVSDKIAVVQPQRRVKMNDEGVQLTGMKMPASMRSLIGAVRGPDAVYRRPVGVAVMPIPAALLHLADGTPHRPSEQLVIVRPAKGEEGRFHVLHRILISEREGTGIAAGGGRVKKAGEDLLAGAGEGLNLSGSLNLVRVPYVRPFSVIVRAFGSLILPLIRDPRYTPLLAPQTMAGTAVSQATTYYWKPPATGRPGSGAQPAGGDNRRAKVVQKMGAPSPGAQAQGSGASLQSPTAGTASVAPAPAEFVGLQVAGMTLTGVHVVGPSRMSSSSSFPGSLQLLATQGFQAPSVAHGHGQRIPTHLLARDVLYVKLMSGMFAQDNKMQARNVQVRVHVLLDTGAVLPCLIRGVPAGLTVLVAGGAGSNSMSPSFGQSGSAAENASGSLPAGCMPMAELRSIVYYHCNSPVWDETLAIHLPNAEQFERAHIRFSFWHASSTDSKTHPFSFAFLPLATSSGVVIKDGVHRLTCYSAPNYNEHEAVHAGTSKESAVRVARDKDGIVPPWYLVARIEDPNGAGSRPSAPVPSSLAATLERNKLGRKSALGTDSVHAAQARDRHLPLTALPVSLGKEYPHVPLPAALTRANSRNSVGVGGPSGSASMPPLFASPHSSGSRGRASSVEEALLSPTATADVNAAGGEMMKTMSSNGTAVSTGTVGEWTGKEGKGVAPRAQDVAQSGGLSRASSSLIAALGLATGGKYDMGRSARGPYGSDQPPWDAFPLVIRPGETFTVETRLVSDYRSNVPEIQALSKWRTASLASICAAVLHVQRMVIADAPAAVRHFPRLLSFCMDALSTLLQQQKHHAAAAPQSAQSSTAVADDAGPDSTPRLEHMGGGQLQQASIRTQSVMLSAVVKLYAALLFTVCPSVRPAIGSSLDSQGKASMGRHGGPIPLGQPVPSALRADKMGAPAVSTFAAAHSLASTLTAGMQCPHGSAALLHLLHAVVQAVKASLTPAALSAQDGSASLCNAGGKVSISMHPAHDASSAGNGSVGSSSTVPDTLKLTLSLETVLALVRTLSSTVALARTFLEQNVASSKFDAQSSGQLLASFRVGIVGILSALLPDEGSEGLGTVQRPSWWRLVQGTVLRQLPSILASLRGILRPSEFHLLLSQALRVPKPLQSSSLYAWQTQQGVALAQLLAVRAMIRCRLFNDVDAAGFSPLSLAVPVLLSNLDASGVQRALALRVAAALLSERDALVALLHGTGHDSAKGEQVLLRQSWALSLLVAEMSTAVTGVMRSRPPLSDALHVGTPSHAAARMSLASGPRGEQCMIPEHKAIIRAAKQAHLPVPVIVDDTLRICVQDELFGWAVVRDGQEEEEHTDSGRVSEHVDLEGDAGAGGLHIGRPRLRKTSSHDGRERTATLAFLRSRMTFAFAQDDGHDLPGTPVDVPLAHATASAQALEKDSLALTEAEYQEAFGPERRTKESAQACATRVLSFYERFQRLCSTSLISLLWGCPPAIGPHILATVSPLASPIGSLVRSSSDPEAIHLVFEQARLRLALQLLHACLSLLSTAPYPPSWLTLGHLMHTTILRVYQWVAGLLASAYSGSSADDAAYWRWSAEFDAFVATAPEDRGGDTGLPKAASWSLALPVWTAWLDLTVALLTSPLFAPESLTVERKKAVLDKYGDRRLDVCQVFRLVWGGALDSEATVMPTKARPVSSVGWAYGVFLGPAQAYTDHTGQTMLALLDKHTISQTAGARVVAPGVCASLRLALAQRLVAPLLDLTHCVQPAVSSMAIDAYLDLLRAELTVTTARRKAGGAWDAVLQAQSAQGQRSMASAPSALSVTGNSALPEMERLTIDAIDVLAAHKGPSLVVTSAAAAASGGSNAMDKGMTGPSTSMTAARPAAMSTTTAFNGLTGQTVRPQHKVAALVRAATDGVTQTVRSGASEVAMGLGKRRRRATLYSVYTPPQDNMLMQLFAPKKVLKRVQTASSMVKGGTVSPAALRNASFFLKQVGAAAGAASPIVGSPGLEGATSRALFAAVPLAAAKAGLGSSLLDHGLEALAEVTSRAEGEDYVSDGEEDASATGTEGEGKGVVMLQPNGGSTSSAATMAVMEDLLAQPTIIQFLREIRTLYAMLSSVAKYPNSSDWEDERAEAALALISYLRNSHRLDIHAKYVAYLCDLHVSLGNKAEAALAYLLHADVLTWNETEQALHSQVGSSYVARILPPLRFADKDVFPAQTASQRLELVLSSAMRDLIAADCWEEAVRVGEILAHRYEHVTYEYNKLSDVLNQNAKLYRRIAADTRVFRFYYVVKYSHSLWFPRSVRGKMFIYRGGENERLGDMTGKLLRKWSTAEESVSISGFSPGSGLGVLVTDPGSSGDDHLEDDDEEEDMAASMTGANAAAEQEARPEISIATVSVAPQFPMHGTSTPGLLDAGPSGVLSPAAQAVGLARSGTGRGGGSAGPGFSAVSTGTAAVQSALSPGLAHSSSESRTPVLVKGGPSFFPLSSPGPLSTRGAQGTSMDDLASTGLHSPIPRSLGEALHSPGLTSPLRGGLQVSGGLQNLLPVILPSAPQASNLHIPSLIRKGREQAGARYFVTQPRRLQDRGFRPETGKLGDHVLDYWSARTYIASQDAFPSTHRRSRVIAVREVALNPVEVAIPAVRLKIQEVQEKMEQALACPDRSPATEQFTNVLKGVVNAGVNGGIENYSALLDGSYVHKYPDIAQDLSQPGKDDLLRELRSAVADTMVMAARAIEVHEQKCTPNNLILHRQEMIPGYNRLFDLCQAWGVKHPNMKRLQG